MISDLAGSRCHTSFRTPWLLFDLIILFCLQILHHLIICVISVNLGAGKLPRGNSLLEQDIKFLECPSTCFRKSEKHPYQTWNTQAAKEKCLQHVRISSHMAVIIVLPFFLPSPMLLGSVQMPELDRSQYR